MLNPVPPPPPFFPSQLPASEQPPPPPLHQASLLPRPPPNSVSPPRHQPRQNPLGTDLASLLVLRTDASCVPLLLLSLPPPIVRRATAKDEKGFFPEIFAPFFSRICQTECGSDLKFRMWHPPRPVYTPSEFQSWSFAQKLISRDNRKLPTWVLFAYLAGIWCCQPQK